MISRLQKIILIQDGKLNFNKYTLMESYSNLSGTSPITHFEIANNSVSVWFKGGKKNPYIYPVYKIGNYHFQQLIQKAISGKGLSTYINQNVRNDFIK